MKLGKIGRPWLSGATNGRPILSHFPFGVSLVELNFSEGNCRRRSYYRASGDR